MSGTVISGGTLRTAPGATSEVPIYDSANAGTKSTMDRDGINYLCSPLTEVNVGNATLALDQTHCGKHIILDHANSAITINTDNIGAGWNCIITNVKTTDYTFPTPTGTGASLDGPINGDTKIEGTAGPGMVTVIAHGNKIKWRGDSTT